MLIWDRARGVCRVVWDREDSGPVWLEFAFLGGTEQRVPMSRVDGCWVAEIPGHDGWLRYGFRTPLGIRPDSHRATVRDHLGRRLSFAVVSPGCHGGAVNSDSPAVFDRRERNERE